MERLGGSIAAHLVAVENGAAIVRVHDVAPTVQALAVAAAIRQRAMSDAIFVNGLVLHAYHGVMPHEGKVGQPFMLDLMLDIDLADASRTDKLKDTVSYEALVKIVSEAFCARRYRLVEAAAGAVADAVLDRYPSIRSVRITVRKPHAPIAATFDDVGVIVVRARASRAAAMSRSHGRSVHRARRQCRRRAHDLRSGYRMLCATTPTCGSIARSSDYRTPPWGVTEQPPFVNAVIAIATTLTPARPAGARRRTASAARPRPRARAALGAAHHRYRPPRL